MAIEAVFFDLTHKFDAMSDALRSLALTVIEDRPARGEVLLVERLGNLVEDLRGWAGEAHEAAVQAREALAHPADLDLARRGLSLANERFLRLEYRFFGEAVAHGTIGELQRFGRQRGREWLSWTGGAVQALDACRLPLRELDEALFRAWQELGERLGSRSLTVQTNNIGQQITAPAAPPRAAPQAERRGGRRRDDATRGERNRGTLVGADDRESE
jgi:hypothetical protein